LKLILSDVVEGGAATAMVRTVDKLYESDKSFQHWHFSAQHSSTPVYSRSLDKRRKRPPVERLLKNISRSLADRLRKLRHEEILKQQVRNVKPQFVHVHNIHDSGLNHDSLLHLLGDIPIFWTMHDCWSFYEHAFEWRNSALGRLETTSSDFPIYAARKRRARFFRERKDTVMIAPSKWMAEQARKALPDDIRIERIPYGIDTARFTPIPKPTARAILGIDPDQVWMGFASTWASSRKGVDVLREALRLLRNDSMGCITWGESLVGELPEGITVEYFGSIQHERLSSLLYSACDFFVCPSRADNLPNTCIESLSCGTPILGSNIGGLPDMIRPGKTGWLYEGDSPEKCADALRTVLAEKYQWEDYQKKARQVALDEYDDRIAAKRHLDLYAEVL
jgi:glycosyltransferase involved in cell wall biosynthesis